MVIISLSKKSVSTPKSKPVYLTPSQVLEHGLRDPSTPIGNIKLHPIMYAFYTCSKRTDIDDITKGEYYNAIMRILDVHGNKAIGYLSNVNESSLMWAIHSIHLDRKHIDILSKITHTIVTNMTSINVKTELFEVNSLGVNALFWSCYVRSKMSLYRNDVLSGIIKHILYKCAKLGMSFSWIPQFDITWTPKPDPRTPVPKTYTTRELLTTEECEILVRNRLL